VDDIIFSGMFTAVQEYIIDAFINAHETNVKDDHPNDEAEEIDDKYVLDELKMGEQKILIERSNNTYLAVIFMGDGETKLRKKVRDILDKIESKYGEKLVNWDGNIRELSGIKEILSVLIKDKNKIELIEPDNKIDILASSATDTSSESSGSDSEALQYQNNQDINASSNSNTIINSEKILADSGDTTTTTLGAPMGFEDNLTVQKVKITMPNGGQKFEIDPTKSLILQLAEMEEKEEKEEMEKNDYHNIINSTQNDDKLE
jgi:hypothetical protein